jgi:hypothetical protein
MKKLLVTRESPCLQPIRELIEEQKHRTLVLWTIDCAPHVLSVFETRYPDDPRPRAAYNAAKAWARGEIKMPTAKRAAHEAHHAATAVCNDPAACAPHGRWGMLSALCMWRPCDRSCDVRHHRVYI